MTSKSNAHSGLKETRYLAEWNRPDWVVMGTSIGAGLLLGTGCYATWLQDPAPEYGNFLLLGGLVVGAVFAFRVTSAAMAVLVGDAGVAIERGGEVSRLLWSELQSVRYEAGHLVLVGAQTTLRLPSQSHTRAIRAVLAEAAERLPKVLDVPAKLADELPKVSGEHPKPEPVAALQIAGKRCQVTNQILTFERDARLCPVCTSVYHREHVPAVCVTCEHPLGKAAVSVNV
jgi:hypothetical protein